MEYKFLGNTQLKVSSICLGTMTWGEQNTEEEAFEQLDYSIENGINFIDTAELYPVPPKKETYALTETYIGNWLSQRKNRDKIILATKVAGKSANLFWIRDGKNCFDRKNIEEALNHSLVRLKTDYIDLYQLHWPDRPSNFFGQLGYKKAAHESSVPIEETLEILNDQVKAGKIRHIGLSNETPWGAMKFLEISNKRNLPRIISIQNPYNLLNRVYEIGLAEVSHREKAGLLAYSPLAFGVLSGKYLDGNMPEKSRLRLFGNAFNRYTGEKNVNAVQEYVHLANANGISPSKMALAFINSRDFVTSNIIGATTMEQLKEDIESIDLKLSDDIYKEIERIHHKNPNPAP